MTLAHYAAEFGRLESLRFLATLGTINLNNQNSAGVMLAQTAAKGEHQDILDFLNQRNK